MTERTEQTDQPTPPEDAPVKTADVKQLYRRPPSFTDLLPWAEYLPESRAFLLEDGISVGALFELTPVGTEARTPRFMAELRDAIQTALTDAIPEDEHTPWVLQVYVQDEPSLRPLQQAVDAYVQPGARDTAFTRHYQAAMKLAELRDLVVTLPTRAAMLGQENPELVILDPPFDIPEMELKMAWSPLLHHNPAHRWLRGVIVDVAREVTS